MALAQLTMPRVGSLRASSGGSSVRHGTLAGGGIVAFLAIGHTAVDAVTSLLGALLPSIQVRFALSETGLALLVATLALSSSVAQPLLGAIADRLGRRMAAALGVIVTALLVSLIGVAPTASVLFALLLLGGLGSAAYHPAGASIARAVSVDKPGLAVSLFGAGGTLGLAIGPVLAVSFIAAFGLGSTPWLMLPGVLVGVLMLFLVPAQPRASDASRPKLLDGRLFAGPVGLLALTDLSTSLAFVTFSSAIPLWLVAARGVPRDAALLGWTLAAFSLAAALGGIAAAALSSRFGRRPLVVGSMLMAPLPLLAVLHLEPGSLAYFGAVMLGGALVNAGLPLKILSAQDLAPQAQSSATGMLMGFTTGVAGLLYVAVGWLQELIGVTQAVSLIFLLPIPMALLAARVLAAPTGAARTQRALAVAAARGSCQCPHALTAETAPTSPL